MGSPGGESTAFACPSCGSPLGRQHDVLECETCGATVQTVEGIPQCPLPGTVPDRHGFFDWLATVYESPLWFRPVYRLLVGPRGPRDDRAELLEGLDWRGATVLDVACGTGRIARTLAPVATTVYAVDRAQGMLRKAARNAERHALGNIAFARMDVSALYLVDRAFDGVTCAWAMHLFPDLRAVLEAFHRVLVPGGWFAGTTICDAGLATIPGIAPLLARTVGARPVAPRTLRHLLEVVGFARIQLDRYGAALFVRAQR